MTVAIYKKLSFLLLLIVGVFLLSGCTSARNYGDGYEELVYAAAYGRSGMVVTERDGGSEGMAAALVGSTPKSYAIFFAYGTTPAHSTADFGIAVFAAKSEAQAAADHAADRGMLTSLKGRTLAYAPNERTLSMLAGDRKD